MAVRCDVDFRADDFVVGLDNLEAKLQELGASFDSLDHPYNVDYPL
jgi:hypothetical protein